MDDTQATNQQTSSSTPKTQIMADDAGLPKKSANDHLDKIQTNTTSSQLPPLGQAPTTVLEPLANITTQNNPSQNQGAAVDEPAIADDNDIIEQEWVNKAKAIVESTKEDPHGQNKEISKLRASYIKKRYNKEIKTSED